MRPLRTPFTSTRPAGRDKTAATMTGSNQPTVARKPPGPTPQPIFSIDLVVRDHARLAERLAGHIGLLRQARARHEDVDSARDNLHAFLAEDLVPYLHSEDAALYGSPGPSGWPGARARRRFRQRLREHQRIISTADTLQSADTTLLALTRAERLRALLEAHLVQEDRELIEATRSTSDDGPTMDWMGALAAELRAVHARDHVRITRAITLATRATQAPDRLDACDHATAALSQHAAVMSSRAYPMARSLLPFAERDAVPSLREDLRSAERALRHLNRTLRGAAGEDRENVEGLWEDVIRDWHRHIADEEQLIRRLAPRLHPEQALALIALLRRPAGHSLTRQHPRLLRGGWPTRLAIHAEYRIDLWRDVLDNRESLRTGD
jgi:hypothetical protein